MINRTDSVTAHFKESDVLGSQLASNKTIDHSKLKVNSAKVNLETKSKQPKIPIK